MKCFFCHDDVGLQCLIWLIENHKKDVGLVVVIDKGDIYYACEEAGINVLIFDSEESLIDRISSVAKNIDSCFLIWWPLILKQRLLDFLGPEVFNTHPSYLPFGRGKNYNFWSLKDQEPFGVTIHKVSSGIDSGNIVCQKRVEYGWHDNGESLFNLAKLEMKKLFVTHYVNLKLRNYTERVQDINGGSFHYGKEMEVASSLDLSVQVRTADLLNLLRAKTFEGFPGCQFESNGKKYECTIKITEVS
jgi:methionyl-tRNA formyltransferase